MKTSESERLLKYHLELSSPQTNAAFLEEVERIKKSGRRLSSQEKGELLKKARQVVYTK
jgi:hypothetical protein